MLTFEEYQEAITELYAMLDSSSKALNEFPKGSMGLTPDSVKKSPEFIEAKKKYGNIFAMVRSINSKAPAKYKRMMRDLQRASKSPA